jgi:hypothetical protein
VADKEAPGMIFSECFPLPVHQHFGGTHCLHLQGLMVSKAVTSKKQAESGILVLFYTQTDMQIERAILIVTNE